jgi:RNA polymerase sigma-70 factor (ECF subfamily)
VTDADLVARARQGDAAAFGELVDRHRTAVFRAALAALGSRADAEDAAQDAFLLAFRRLGTFRGDASFKTWLLAIAWRQAINRRRGVVRMLKRMVHPISDHGDDEAVAFVAQDGPTPERIASGRELLAMVVQEIRALPAALRDALVLAQSGAYTYEEIGAMLGCPVGTIKWRVSEARRSIRRRLAERGQIEVV